MRTFQDILEDAGYKCKAYGGRGMGGDTCLSVTFDRADSTATGHLFADVLGALTEENDDGEIEATSKAFRKMRTDNLGLGSVVYFPGIKFEE